MNMIMKFKFSISCYPYISGESGKWDRNIANEVYTGRKGQQEGNLPNLRATYLSG